MISPGKILKLKPEKDLFVHRHSDFVQFLKNEFGGDVCEGDELVVTYKHSDGQIESSSVVFTSEDLHLIQILSDLF